MWGNTNKPCVGMVVRSTSLTAEICITSKFVGPASQCRTCSLHTALQQLLEEKSTLVGQYLFLLFRSSIDFFAVAIYDTGDKDGVVCFTVIDRCTICIDEFKEVDIATTQGECRGS